MIIRMAKVELVGPKDDLLEVLELLCGRGVFQPDPLLLRETSLSSAERPKSRGSFPTSTYSAERLSSRSRANRRPNLPLKKKWRPPPSRSEGNTGN